MKKKNKRIKELEQYLQHALKTVHSGMVAIEKLKKENETINLNDAEFDADTAQNMCRNRDDDIIKLNQAISMQEFLIEEQKTQIAELKEHHDACMDNECENNGELKSINMDLSMKITNLERELTEANNKIAEPSYQHAGISQSLCRKQQG